MARCEVCGEGSGKYSYECSYCGAELCSDHRLPEHHDCSGGSAGDLEEQIMQEKLSTARDRHDVSTGGGVSVTNRRSETSGTGREIDTGNRSVRFAVGATLLALVIVGSLWLFGVI